MDKVQPGRIRPQGVLHILHPVPGGWVAACAIYRGRAKPEGPPTGPWAIECKKCLRQYYRR